MATAEAVAGGAAHGHHEELSFVRKYIFSTDHKIIGIQFLFTCLVFLAVGGLLAMMIRWQLGFPGQPLPGAGVLGEARAPGGIILPEFYNSLVTMHGTFMIFFAIMPLLVGVYANYLIPLKLGAPDMAFPTLNMMSFWVFVASGVVMLASLFVTGGAAGAGWTVYAPLSAVPDYTGVYLGQQLWVVSIVLFGASSLLGSVNYITTVINMRAPGMTLFRMPLSIWALFITAILALLAVPVLAGAVIMLLFDQTIGTTFFLPADGGQPLLWQHLFWFFGHPEVYILILPAMGIVSDVIANGSRKPIFGYHSMVFAIIAIAFLGWIVWGHHMFQSGMNPLLGTSFMISTMAIAVPSAIKVFNWLGTMWRGNIQFHTPMLNAVGFVALFTIGGLSGIFMASNTVDVFIHDTYFIVAHIHYVLFGGSLFGIFAAIYFWFPKMFGRMMNETWGKIHFALTFILYNLVFFPMHILGMGGHMRRIYDPTEYEFLQRFQGMNEFITVSAFLLFVAQIPFLVNFFWSLFRGEKAGENPWHDNGLEWTTPSPPPHGNFATAPTVYHGPYEFSHPEAEEDFLPQNQPLGGG
ncbi:MAG: cytochrome c oxidase subunit I [Gemmatimonadetes bacterium]|uniref:Cytochrome c oxidase subunit I n=1 Tax=Candidatus Kutchimonas denitrificans TaxID=3056748 RepID=A0AAE4ZAV8_9BACT|nr:cytochrome c oxidase subunit I [Gemmatimonadota bacterium]NIR76258.1 cytochrome c oxidase subunit I [Candidatus Kutchimonas denitrificans]NIS02281.1 cytochrome c oxidase subunit I [Gemmatimonadota bacterium]NIT68100.1 cytochrome c oxidase subunit I [Gemmatimonadota bacterium]NIU54324.1 cytochrome c oxidase subunit I [Gemmatimonadota bacterium]